MMQSGVTVRHTFPPVGSIIARLARRLGICHHQRAVIDDPTLESRGLSCCRKCGLAWERVEMGGGMASDVWDAIPLSEFERRTAGM